jgi:hypothetical protein
MERGETKTGSSSGGAGRKPPGGDAHYPAWMLRSISIRFPLSCAGSRNEPFGVSASRSIASGRNVSLVIGSSFGDICTRGRIGAGGSPYDPMSSSPVTLRGATTLSRSGTLFAWFAVVWMLGGLIGADVIFGLFLDGASRPWWFIWLKISVAFLPAIIVMLPGALGRYRLFRWLLARPQPSATINDLGLDVCLPDRGCQRFQWDEIGRLVPTRLTGWQRWTTRYPGFDLCAPDGRVLATLPYFVAFPAGAHWRGPRQTLAEMVVDRHPERFGLLRPPGPMTPFLTFGRAGEGPPLSEIAIAKRRRRTIRWLINGGLIALSILGFISVTGLWPR